MFFLNNYNDRIIKYDLINKFNYKNVISIPKLEFIILTFNLKKWDSGALINLLSSLKLIILKTPKITTSKISNVVFKIRKGQPIGCKLTLRKIYLHKFLFILINKILPKSKFTKISKHNMFSLTLKNVLIFNELEQNYQFFKNLPGLNIHFKFSKSTYKELIYLIKSYKLLT